MSDATQAKGTLLQVETSEGSGVYVTIPEVKDITGPGFSSGTYDATTHSTAGVFKETKAGLINPPTVSFPINYIPGNVYHQQLVADKVALTERNYKQIIALSTGRFFAFRASVTEFSSMYPVDGLTTANVTLLIVSAPTVPV